MRRSCVVALVAALAAPCTAQATRVVGIATGVVADYAETDANGARVFGLDENELPGAAVRIDFAYDTALAPADSDPPTDSGNYESDQATPDWLDLAITVNGVTHVLGGDERRVSVFDGTPIMVGYDSFQVSIDHFYGEPEGGGPYEVFRREFLDFIEALPEDTLTGDGLPTAFATDPIFPTGNSANFRINESDYDPVAMEVTYSRYVAFDIDLHEITVMPVPEPTSASLLALGLLTLAGTRRR